MSEDFPFELISSEVVPETATGTSPSGRAKGICDECGKELTITGTGDLRSHKCVNDVQTSPTAKAKSPGRKSTVIPKKVRTLGVNATAAGVETGTAYVLARGTGIPQATLAAVAELPDPDVMIGPFLDLLWPQVPKGAQKVITELADRSDILVALYAWWEWGSKLRAFTLEHRIDLSPTASTPTPRSTDNGQVSGPHEGGGRHLAVAPFSPVADSSGGAFVPGA